MPDLTITVEKAEVVPFAASPMLAFKLRVKNADLAETIHTVVLRCQVQIEVARRRYTAAEQERLRDLFGEPERWGQTLRNLLWTNTSAIIPQFTGVTSIDLQVPCTFDFTVATTSAVSWSVRVKVAPGTAAPEESARMPEMVAPSWAKTGG